MSDSLAFHLDGVFRAHNNMMEDNCVRVAIAGYLAPESLITIALHATHHVLRSFMPHFSVLKRGGKKGHRSFQKRQSDDPDSAQRPDVSRSHAISLFAHSLRQVPLFGVEVLAVFGREAAASTVLLASLQSSSLLSGVNSALLRLIQKLSTSQRLDSDEWSLSHAFTHWSETLPLRLCLFVAAEWVERLVSLDQSIVVSFLRSRKVEHHVIGWMGRVFLKMLSEPFTRGTLTLSILLLSDEGATNLQKLASLGRGEDSTRVALLSGAVCSLVGAIVRHVILPKAATAVTRVFLWGFENLEYWSTRRYVDIARHFDDVDSDLLTDNERRMKHERLEESQRRAVLRGIAMRAIASAIAAVVVGHPLNVLATVCDNRAVLHLTGQCVVLCEDFPSSADISLAYPVRVFAWTIRQVVREIGVVRDNVVTASEVSVNAAPRQSNNISVSIQLLIARLHMFTPLYCNWQYGFILSLATLHFSTLGRINYNLL